MRRSRLPERREGLFTSGVKRVVTIVGEPTMLHPHRLATSR